MANQENFIMLFNESMKDSNVRVKVATLKALTSFITSLDDEDQVLKYQDMMGGLLDITIEVLKTDEEQGGASLESLIELSSTYPQIWTSNKEKLLFVCSEIIKNKDFEDKTRQSALEIISTLCEEEAKMLRSMPEKMKSDFFPAIFIMFTEVEN